MITLPRYPSETQMCFPAFSESLKQRKKSVYMMSPNELSASKLNIFFARF